jgi:hypothetical protein
MKKEIEEQLNEWKVSEEFHLPTKQFKIIKSPIVKDEYVIRLTRNVKVTFSNLSRVISITKKIHTHCQSAESLSQNINADKLILSRLMKQLDDEFFEIYIKTENELIQEVMPDGFF